MLKTLCEYDEITNKSCPSYQLISFEVHHLYLNVINDICTHISNAFNILFSKYMTKVCYEQICN